MTAHLLTKLTAAAPWGIGAGGIPDLTGVDVAAGLAHCPCEHSYITLTAKYCDDSASLKALQELVGQKVLGRMFRERLEHSEGYYIGSRRIALIILWQVLGGYHCTTCGGSGEVDNKTCPTCEGSKRGQLSDEARARMMGIRGYQNFKPMITEIEAEVNSWEEDGLTYLRWHLGK